MTLIVDASVALKWFVHEDLHEEALRLLDHVELLQAPDLIVAEVTNIAWKKRIRGEITSPQAEALATAIRQYIPVLHSSTELNERALEIALALNHPVYDCLYIACAEKTDAILITADERLCKATKETDFEIFVQHLGAQDFQSTVLPPLRISLSKIRYVIELAKNLTTTRRHVDEALWGENDPEQGPQFRPAHESGSAWASVPKQQITTSLKALSPDERAELLALMWLGRGYEEDRIEWSELLQRAHPPGDEDDIRYLTGLVDCLEAGLAYFRENIAFKRQN